MKLLGAGLVEPSVKEQPTIGSAGHSDWVGLLSAETVAPLYAYHVHQRSPIGLVGRSMSITQGQGKSSKDLLSAIGEVVCCCCSVTVLWALALNNPPQPYRCTSTSIGTLSRPTAWPSQAMP